MSQNDSRARMDGYQAIVTGYSMLACFKLQVASAVIGLSISLVGFSCSSLCTVLTPDGGGSFRVCSTPLACVFIPTDTAIYSLLNFVSAYAGSVDKGQILGVSAAQLVDVLGDRFQVGRVNAHCVSTQVVKGQSGGNWPFHQCVNETMTISTRATRHCLGIYRSVTSVGFSSRPRPTGVVSIGSTKLFNPVFKAHLGNPLLTHMDLDYSLNRPLQA